VVEADTPIRDLTDLQLALLEVLWDRGEASVAEVQEALVEERGLAASTVATILSRLERRGVLARRNEGRLYLYRPLVTREQVTETQVSALAARLFEGDVAALVNHLITKAQISPGDLARVRQLLAGRADDGEDDHAN
jgi:BlaI family transcriptional regulator, penicillinase repressor